MKLQSIALCDFRAFPGPGEYVFDFGAKNHLLIYGENGSGKTSVFRALMEFFNFREQAAPFRDLKNFDSDATENMSLVCGNVALMFSEPPVVGAAPVLQRKTWGITPPGSADSRLRTDPLVREVARRKGLFDYQALVRANLAVPKDPLMHLFGASTPERPNLFEVAVNDLFYHYPVVVTGGSTSTLGKAWEEFQRVVGPRPLHVSNKLQRIQDAEEDFNAAMEQATVSARATAERLLQSYFHVPLTFSFIYRGAHYDRQKKPGQRKITPGYFGFDVQLNGRSFPKYEDVLNEAKLSALALCVYFAGLIEGIPASASAAYPKLLVLDDVLIGLDMQNRLPVLHILEQEFSAAGWQIILLTHDKVWYDYASHVAIGLDWACHELYADRVPIGTGGWNDQPLLRTPNEGAGDYLQRAKKQMLLHDHKAAGMYARAAYERALKKYCSDRHLPIPFNLNADKINSEAFFKATKDDVNNLNRKVSGVVKPVPLADLAAINAIFTDIELHRKQVLNPMSHAPVVPLTAPEVQAAIDSVDKMVGSLQTVSK